MARKPVAEYKKAYTAKHDLVSVRIEIPAAEKQLWIEEASRLSMSLTRLIRSAMMTIMARTYSCSYVDTDLVSAEHVTGKVKEMLNSYYGVKASAMCAAIREEDHDEG